MLLAFFEYGASATSHNVEMHLRGGRYCCQIDLASGWSLLLGGTVRSRMTPSKSDAKTSR